MHAVSNHSIEAMHMIEIEPIDDDATFGSLGDARRELGF